MERQRALAGSVTGARKEQSAERFFWRHAVEWNRVFASGLTPVQKPSHASRGLTHTTGQKADYVARVRSATARCSARKAAPSIQMETTSRLADQRYGETTSPKIRFGLLTGLYYNNVSGGVLRKGISDNLSDEINTSTDGTLKYPVQTGAGNPAK